MVDVSDAMLLDRECLPNSSMVWTGQGSRGEGSADEVVEDGGDMLLVVLLLGKNRDEVDGCSRSSSISDMWGGGGGGRDIDKILSKPLAGVLAGLVLDMLTNGQCCLLGW